jgi:hypothetical protein
MFYMISFDHSNEILYTMSMLPLHLVLFGAKKRIKNISKSDSNVLGL